MSIKLEILAAKFFTNCGTISSQVFYSLCLQYKYTWITTEMVFKFKFKNKGSFQIHISQFFCYFLTSTLLGQLVLVQQIVTKHRQNVFYILHSLYTHPLLEFFHQNPVNQLCVFLSIHPFTLLQIQEQPSILHTLMDWFSWNSEWASCQQIGSQQHCQYVKWKHQCHSN